MKLNITSKLLSLFVVAALTLTSCGDDDKDGVSPIDNATDCKITGVADDDGSVSEVTYNSNGYITKITSLEVDGEVEYEYVIEFTYDNNKLVKEEYFEDGEPSSVITYTYANGVLKTKTYNSEWEDNYVETYTFDANNRVVKIEGNDDYVETFTYSGNNVSESVSTYMGELFQKVKYENYDNKLQPFAAVKGMLQLSSGSSINNPGKVTESYYYNGEVDDSYVTTYSYQYNSNNLPTKITETDSDGDTDVTNFTYQCN